MKLFTATVTLLLGCGQGHAAPIDSTGADSVARVRQDSVNRAQPGYVVDSILPIEEQLRRFRADLTEVPGGFEGGAASRQSLVRSFVRSIEAGDTASLIRMTISRAEFAYLVYPDSPLSARPYMQSPDLVWMRHSSASGTGLHRLVARLSGLPLGFRSVTCGESPTTEGANRIWRDCSVRFARDGGEETSLRLFAGIIGREGRYKILSYANAF